MKKIHFEQILADNRCLILLFCFLCWFVTGPLALQFRLAIEAYAVAYLALLIAGSFFITGNRTLLYISALLGILVFYEWTTHFKSNNLEVMKLCGLSVLFFDFILTFAMIYHTSVAGKFSRDLIFGVVFTFFMIGQCFGDAFYVIQYWGLVKFNMAGITDSHLSILDCTYFSFTTLTTAGYGDIVPTTIFAKRLGNLEQCIGVLYVAVFVGRLMNTYSSFHSNKKQVE